jgi:hypothetical protein
MVPKPWKKDMRLGKWNGFYLRASACPEHRNLAYKPTDSKSPDFAEANKIFEKGCGCHVAS